MSRDMKVRGQYKPAAKKKSGGGTLLGLFLGLVVGVVAAAGVVWYINKMPLPFTAKGQPPPAPAPAVGAKPQQAGVAAAAPAPALLPGKPGDPVPQPGDKPRFDFYKILPGNAEAIPDPKQADAKAKGDKDSAAKESIFLQAGSFQSAADADNQKARLALVGAEASIQQVMVQDKVWYRVRLGPFAKTDEANRTRADLAKQGIEATVAKKD